MGMEFYLVNHTRRQYIELGKNLNGAFQMNAAAIVIFLSSAHRCQMELTDDTGPEPASYKCVGKWNDNLEMTGPDKRKVGIQLRAEK